MLFGLIIRLSTTQFFIGLVNRLIKITTVKIRCRHSDHAFNQLSTVTINKY